jgi:hypothetical protein
LNHSSQSVRQQLANRQSTDRKLARADKPSANGLSIKNEGAIMKISGVIFCRFLIVGPLVFSLVWAERAGAGTDSQSIYIDRPFLQAFAEKIPLATGLSGAKLMKVRADRNGRILVLSNNGLLQIYDGKLVSDRHYRPMLDMQIKDFDICGGQFVFLTDKAVLSNAWAGRLYVPHDTVGAKSFTMADNSDHDRRQISFVVMGTNTAYFRDGNEVQRWPIGKEQIEQVHFDRKRSRFLVLSMDRLDCLQHEQEKRTVFEGTKLNCLELAKDGSILILGTGDGYIELDADSFRPRSAPQTRLPWPDIRCIRQIGQKIWFGTPRGAFALHSNGQIDYYASRRWLLDDNVIDISKGPNHSVLILTQLGLNIIHFKSMTLKQKADHFDRLTRKRHVRYGLNSAFVMSKPGDLSTGTLVDQDNDGLWTAMYLAGEVFRYAVTGSEEALRNCHESFDAMERLAYINPLEGFPSRSFERRGYELADKSRWHATEDQNWARKGTTSSDEIVGHFFAYSIFAELIQDQKWRGRAVALMDRIMNHIVQNDWYLIDYDGKPTLWGRWNPSYVNQFPRQVGDRRLNSIEIISFLQATYHFTGKDVYKKKALELLQKHGYLDNIMIPVRQLARVPGIDLTTEWNHSDDELAFLAYWNLYKYAFSDQLRDKYRQAIEDHWQIERPEKNPLWNLIYSATEATDFDIEQTVWSLKEFPLDTISWSVENSHRKDLDFLEPNFRQQTTRQLLPPDERPMGKYNVNPFRLDGGDGGHREYSGDIFCLPYWMGRYLKTIQ